MSRHRFHGLATGAMLIVIAGHASAQPARPVTENDPTAAITALRTELVDSFNKGDVNRLLVHVDPDVVVTWQNAEVCRGPEAVRKYYDRMMTGPDRVVTRLSANPVVDDRHVYGDWAVSWGNLHDTYVLKDGSEFKFDSRFTATIARRGSEWKVTSFHASINAFENPILGIVARRVGVWTGVIVGLVALAAGGMGGYLVARRRSVPKQA